MLSIMEEIRSSTIQSTMSFEDLDRWMGRYHLPESCNLVTLGFTNSMMVLSSGKVALNEEILWAGTHLSFSCLVIQVLWNLGVAPT